MFHLFEWQTAQTIILFSFTLYIICKVINITHNFVRSRTIQPFSVPEIKGNKLYIYFSNLIAAYRQSTPECPALCLALQWVLGYILLYGQNGFFRWSILIKKGIICYKPETVKAVLSNPELIEKSRDYELARPFLGNGLITSTKQKWQKHRKLLTPAFHFNILEEFIPVVQKQTDVLISKIQSCVRKPWIDAQPLLYFCSLDIICETAMGVSINAQINEDCEYSSAIQQLGDIVFHRLLRPWLYPEKIFNLTKLGKRFNANLQIVRGLNEKVLREKKSTMTPVAGLHSKAQKHVGEVGEGSHHPKRKPFLELLLEYHLEDPSFTEQDIRDEVETFMFAGHDTTATTTNFVLYFLGVHQEIQRAVHQELDRIFENQGSEDISRETLTKMKYLECVIKETMRLYPIVMSIVRESNQTFKVSEHDVTPGTVCGIFILALHRDPESFPDPEKFDPDRFLPENSKSRHPYAYIPFSAGPRNCIGQKFAMMSIKTMLASILMRFRVISLDSRDKVLLLPNIVTKTVKPLRMRFESRR